MKISCKCLYRIPQTRHCCWLLPFGTRPMLLTCLQTYSRRLRYRSCNIFGGAREDKWLSYTSARIHPKTKMTCKLFVYWCLLIYNRLHTCTLLRPLRIWPMARWRQKSGNRATRHTLYMDNVMHLMCCENGVHVYIYISIQKATLNN